MGSTVDNNFKYSMHPSLQRDRDDISAIQVFCIVGMIFLGSIFVYMGAELQVSGLWIAGTVLDSVGAILAVVKIDHCLRSKRLNQPEVKKAQVADNKWQECKARTYAPHSAL